MKTSSSSPFYCLTPIPNCSQHTAHPKNIMLNSCRRAIIWLHIHYSRGTYSTIDAILYKSKVGRDLLEKGVRWRQWINVIYRPWALVYPDDTVARRRRLFSFPVESHTSLVQPKPSRAGGIDDRYGLTHTILPVGEGIAVVGMQLRPICHVCILMTILLDLFALYIQIQSFFLVYLCTIVVFFFEDGSYFDNGNNETVLGRLWCVFTGRPPRGGPRKSSTSCWPRRSLASWSSSRPKEENHRSRSLSWVPKR